MAFRLLLNARANTALRNSIRLKCLGLLVTLEVRLVKMIYSEAIRTRDGGAVLTINLPYFLGVIDGNL